MSKERDKAIYYRETFGTPHGQAVLTSILNDLGYFAPAVTPGEVALRNYADKLLHDMGILTAENINRVVVALMSVPIPEEPKNE